MVFDGISRADDAIHRDVHELLVEKLKDGSYSRRGADVCLGCHDEEEAFPTALVFATSHGHPKIEGSPFDMSGGIDLPAGLQCEACHGPLGNHGMKILPPGQSREPMLDFAVTKNARPELQNHLCLACHEDYNRMYWQSSPHQLSGLVCANCHEIHDPLDRVRTRNRQVDICLECHQAVEAQFMQLSSHPIDGAHTICTDCHDPHGTVAESRTLVKGDSLNESCFQCHSELRGPFTWEHPPVVEDCSICHLPHGATQPSLLKTRAPQLCQSCHSSVGHRSFALEGDIDTTDPDAMFVFSKGCLNCHSSVHGSDHPSGNLFRR